MKIENVEIKTTLADITLNKQHTSYRHVDGLQLWLDSSELVQSEENGIMTPVNTADHDVII